MSWVALLTRAPIPLRIFRGKLATVHRSSRREVARKGYKCIPKASYAKSAQRTCKRFIESNLQNATLPRLRRNRLDELVFVLQPVVKILHHHALVLAVDAHVVV